MHMRRISVGLLVLATLGNTSCAVGVRAIALCSTGPQPLFFMGVLFDYVLITDTIRESGLVGPVGRVFGVIDMPISVVLHVVLLPIDGLVWLIWRDPENPDVQPRDPGTRAPGQAPSKSVIDEASKR